MEVVVEVVVVEVVVVVVVLVVVVVVVVVQAEDIKPSWTLHNAAFRDRITPGAAANALPLAAQHLGASSTVPERPLRRTSVHQPAVSRQHVASSSGRAGAAGREGGRFSLTSPGRRAGEPGASLHVRRGHTRSQR